MFSLSLVGSPASRCGLLADLPALCGQFKDSLHMMDSAPEISSLAAQVPDGTDGLVFVSAFGGLLAPHWRDDARATLVGLTLAHDRRHIARAVLEGIAFQARDVVGAMEADTGVALTGLRVDGGVSLSNELLQYQCVLACAMHSAQHAIRQSILAPCHRNQKVSHPC